MDEGEMLILFVGILIVPPFLKLMKSPGPTKMSQGGF